MNRADTPGSRLFLHLDGQPVEVHFVSHPRARFYDAVITEPAEVPVLSR